MTRAPSVLSYVDDYATFCSIRARAMGVTAMRLMVTRLMMVSVAAAVLTLAPAAAIRAGSVPDAKTSPIGSQVLIAGGEDLPGAALDSAELYDPTAQTFTALSSLMSEPREHHTSTRINGTLILITGGENAVPPAAPAGLYTADLFSSKTRSLTPTRDNMVSGHSRQTATLTKSGKVLIAGGLDNTGAVTGVAENFKNQKGGTFTVTSNPLRTKRNYHTATKIKGGLVLLTGGIDPNGLVLQKAEIFNIANGTFNYTLGNMINRRSNHTATLLNNGNVLITGGYNGNGVPQNTAEIFNPSTRNFTATVGPMNFPRAEHTATLLQGGRVFICGGVGTSQILSTAEIYDPTTGTFTTVGPKMTDSRAGHTATLLKNGTVLIAGGMDQSGAIVDTAEIYNSAGSSSFKATAHTMNAARRYHTATLIQ